MGRRFTSFSFGHAATIFALVLAFFLTAASRGLAGQEQGAPEPARKKTDWPWQDPAPGKVVASQTAFVQEKGTFNFNFSTTTLLDFYDVLNIFDVTYGVTRDFEIRASTIVPYYLFLGVGIFPKYSIQLSEYFRMGYMLDFSVVKQYYAVGSQNLSPP
jgi:hypothetical protein